jgi:predicted transposase YbfD/YdcC
MSPTEFNSIAVHFADLDDPRRTLPKHPLINILVIGLCAVICGCEHFTQMETFGQKRRRWLEKFLDLTQGIPSHDTFNAVFACLKPSQFEACLVSWVQSLHQESQGEILNIDGKTLRGSKKAKGNCQAVHMVSCWAEANHLSLGSVVVEEKSNEIPAIPKLLELIEIQGALVTIDAMGCQREIAKTIVEKEADYVLQVKDNQPALKKAIEDCVEKHVETDFANIPHREYVTHEKSHGREEYRTYLVLETPKDFSETSKWEKLEALGVVMNEIKRDGQLTYSIRYYILSRYLEAELFAKAVRGHWSIENNLHWQLDVTFHEDQLKIGKHQAPVNMSVLMRTALSLLKQEQSCRQGIKTKRLCAALDEEYLEKVLLGQ